MSLDIDELKRTLQDHFAEGLVTIIGSGLSVAEGLPGMKELATQLVTSIQSIDSDDDRSQWEAIRSSLNQVTLEQALTTYPPSRSLEMKIVRETSKILYKEEEEAVERILSGERTLALCHLFRRMRKSDNGIPIITTNYDRLIEFAAELSGIGVDRMFVGSHFGKFDEKLSALSFCKRISEYRGRVRYHMRERIKLFKPHGSLDWYLRNNEVVAYNGRTELPPLIITPGTNKYREGYEMPFDRHRERANQEISSAQAFLIVGYGFNDDHLETHLKAAMRKQKPCIIITRTLYEKGEQILELNGKAIAFLYQKESTGEGTLIRTRGETHFLCGIHMWNLHDFVSEVFRDE
ncbi:MAG: SIR2 family protein [Pseudomonadota bacterium]